MPRKNKVKEPSQEEYKKYTERVFAALKEKHNIEVEPQHTEYDGITYFIDGADGIYDEVEFRVKGCKGWDFGIWWDYDEDNGLPKFHFFTQHRGKRDKFKPGRSVFNECDLPVHYLFDLSVNLCADIVKYIKRHPYRAYYFSDKFPDVWEYDDSRFAFFRYVWEQKIGAVIPKFFYNRFNKVWKGICYRVGKEQTTVDGEVRLHDSGLSCSPRYDVIVSKIKRCKSNWRFVEADRMSPKLRRKFERYKKWYNLVDRLVMDKFPYHYSGCFYGIDPWEGVGVWEQSSLSEEDYDDD